jgi:hypothetical protein
MHDRLIAAESLALDSLVLTRDEVFTASPQIETRLERKLLNRRVAVCKAVPKRNCCQGITVNAAYGLFS